MIGIRGERTAKTSFHSSSFSGEESKGFEKDDISVLKAAVGKGFADSCSEYDGRVLVEADSEVVEVVPRSSSVSRFSITATVSWS